jgi:ATP-dependent phosphofructokinase / diphosphate-dependent phosphofructokinase
MLTNLTRESKRMRKTIGVMTSGGDCAGLNAALRAIACRAIETYGWRVYGIKNATVGLMARPVLAEEFTVNHFDSRLLRQGGTLLGAVNTGGDPFAYPMPDGTIKDRTQDMVEGYRLLGLDAMICIGGDGSLAILRQLAQAGNMNMVGIPKTIDNDVAYTETSIGYDTAVQVAVEALDKLQPTAASHNRIMILEVMGRDAGHIALAAGIAGGADVILIPEQPYKLAKIKEKVEHIRRQGRNFALVIVAEAVKTEDGQPLIRKYHGNQSRYGGIGQYLAEKLSEMTGAETRVTVLGHVQRGGEPSPHDRVLASAFGVHAVDLVAQGKFDRMVAWSNRQVIDVPIEQAIAGNQEVDLQGTMANTARGLGVYLGD